MNAFWVTFYSYKGGVGRTTSLVNVAASLANEGRRVLIIDFDLEAPGLDSFSELGCAKGHPGVVEYTAKYLEDHVAPDIADYVHECSPPSVECRGKLWLMSSGTKNKEYNRTRARINWTELYDQHDGALFIENWKADIERKFSPDYVLIDSRTGVTDVGGICTLHFPQLVVLLFSLNNQNVEGIASVARAINAAEATRVPQILTVATPVPPMIKEKEGLLQRRLEFAEQSLGFPPHCTIHYDPSLALQERVLCWDKSASHSATEYRRLRDRITAYDVKGLDFLLHQATAAIEDRDNARLEAVLNDLLTDYPDRAETHHEAAKAARQEGDAVAREAHLRKAVAVDPLYDPAFNELLSLLKQQRRFEDAAQQCQERIKLLEGDAHEERNSDLHTELGEIEMVIGDYKKATKAFEVVRSLRKQKKGVMTLVVEFNQMEARRRAQINVAKSELKRIIELYEASVSAGAGPADWQLNQLQAMHIPYAMLGRMDKARQLLLQAKELARAVSPRERVYCVADYEYLPLDEFLNCNEKMLTALDSHQLWDGYRLAENAPPSDAT